MWTHAEARPKARVFPDLRDKDALNWWDLPLVHEVFIPAFRVVFVSVILGGGLQILFMEKNLPWTPRWYPISRGSTRAAL
ncbi:hypothetical protein RRG08_048773 [Elysia crispata]|uniref:Uncharacterized protein n=1 Tax=Elysia crispata TaxID=231223 RepID=A0AAE1APX4_9GAST|nr:hypothetical protein RRG08_048773 [Elysia crispata]